MKEDLNLLEIQKSKIKQFNSKGIYSLEDLINFIPRKYYDFTKNTLVKDMEDSNYYAIIGKVIEVKPGDKVIIVKIVDNMSWKMNICFFGMPFIKNKIKIGQQYVFCGRVSTKGFIKSMSNPVIFTQNIREGLRIVPVYSKINGMSVDYLIKTLSKAITIYNKNDYLERDLVKKYNLISTAQKINYLHSPNNLNEVDLALKRIEFDELFKFNMQLFAKENNSSKDSKFLMTKFDESAKLMKLLPFSLTEGQRLALRQMSLKMKSGKRLNALVQADVGAGKTIVAIFLMLIACNNGFQSALMCPTTVLAEQHFNEVKERLAEFGYNIVYLTGNTKKREKTKIQKGLKDGSINMVIGTHAVISKDIEFKNLALIVVDEEHRFGVEQREALALKAENGVHSISMSATPIPRSLALTMYGDSIDVINIKSLPNGRKPVNTRHIKDDKDAYKLMESEIKKGKQCYIVCPFIEENEKFDDVESVESTFKDVKKYFSNKAKVGMINGSLSKEDIEEEILKFKNKEYDILVSTTIIEVGVNVPNATVILIKNSERFGLAQLHQLRGRVGRGSDQGYCLLQSECKTNFAYEKIKVMCETTDGFKISQKDLELRGTGSFVGTSQSGYNKYVELMIANPIMNNSIREDIKAIYESSGRLNHYKFLNDFAEDM